VGTTPCLSEVVQAGGRSRDGRGAYSRFPLHLMATTRGVTKGFGRLRLEILPVRGKRLVEKYGDAGMELLMTIQSECGSLEIAAQIQLQAVAHPPRA
jgi:hypothetical protein